MHWCDTMAILKVWLFSKMGDKLLAKAIEQTVFTQFFKGATTK